MRRDGLAQRRGEGVERAALEAGAGDAYRLAAHARAPEGERDSL